MSITVRPLVSDDQAAWERLWDGYLEFYETSLPREVTAKTWERLLDREHAIRGMCAVDAAGQLVGIVHFLFHPATWSSSERCYLEDLFVDPQCRSQGAGKALVQAVYEAADEANADQVYWLTEQSNHTAMRLYDRVGRRTAFIKYQR